MANIKALLLEASDSQMDASMFPLIEKWDDEPTSLQILEVLDHCIHGSLASGFIVHLLQTLYDRALTREGKRHDQNVPLATWRKEHEST